MTFLNRMFTETSSAAARPIQWREVQQTATARAAVEILTET